MGHYCLGFDPSIVGDVYCGDPPGRCSTLIVMPLLDTEVVWRKRWLRARFARSRHSKDERNGALSP